MANTAAPETAHEETKVPKSYAEFQNQVGIRAHEIYEKRGREEGHALQDWRQAESELAPRGVKQARRA